MSHAGIRRNAILLPVLLAGAAGCSDPHGLQSRLQAYRDARRAGDTVTVAQYLAPDARIWFGEKSGPGSALRPEGGPYKDWDREFRSQSTLEHVRVQGRTVTYVSQENNDFYRLIERQPTRARVTCYFDDSGMITGMLYRGLSTPQTRPPDRFDEFKAWAAEHYPGLLESPDMEIPNHPRRWRRLLMEWRADSGLPETAN